GGLRRLHLPVDAPLRLLRGPGGADGAALAGPQATAGRGGRPAELLGARRRRTPPAVPRAERSRDARPLRPQPASLTSVPDPAPRPGGLPSSRTRAPSSGKNLVS